MLPDNKKEKYGFKRNYNQLFQTIFAYWLLQYSTDYLNIHLRLSENQYGKPYDLNGKYYFNISHCKDAVACIIGNTFNGIDVESIINKNCYDIIKKKVCNKNELVLLRNSDEPLVEFTKLWTFKESYLKMMGTGIIGDLKKVCYNNCNVFFESKVYEKFVLTYCSINKEELYEVSSDKIIAYISNQKKR